MTLRVEGTPGQGAASIQPFEIHIAPLNIQGECPAAQMQTPPMIRLAVSAGSALTCCVCVEIAVHAHVGVQHDSPGHTWMVTLKSLRQQSLSSELQNNRRSYSL